MAERPLGVPPGHIPVVMLTPEQYAIMNRENQVSPYFALYSATRLGHMIADILKLDAQNILINKLRASIRNETVFHSGLCYDARTLSLNDLETKVLDTIVSDFDFLMSAWVTGNLAGMGSSFATAIENFKGSSQLLYAYKDLKYQVAITPRLRRHWNEVYTPSVPNFITAWQMWRRGSVTKDQLYTYAGYDGWSREWVDKLLEVTHDIPNVTTAIRLLHRNLVTPDGYKMMAYQDGWELETAEKLRLLYERWPTAHEAFYMNMKGIIDLQTRNKFYKAEGYPDDMFTKLTANFEIPPTTHEAFYMEKKGLIAAQDRDSIYKSHGIPEKWHTPLTKNYEWRPSIAEAFYMWKKGLVARDKMVAYFRANGVPEDLIDSVLSNQERTLTVYDLVRIADYIEVDLIWATRVLQESGHKARDIPKLIEMIRYRPLREEVRNLTNQLVWRYEYGRMELNELTTELNKLPIGTTEKSLITDYAEMRYEDELITEQMFILKWRFRMGWITDDDYLADLMSLGIREEKANLIVESEKAQGYFGYY